MAKTKQSTWQPSIDLIDSPYTFGQQHQQYKNRKKREEKKLPLNINCNLTVYNGTDVQGTRH